MKQSWPYSIFLKNLIQFSTLRVYLNFSSHLPFNKASNDWLCFYIYIHTVKGRRIYEPAIICKLYVYYNDQIRYASFIPLAPSSWHSEVPTYVTSCFIMHFLYIHNNRYNGFAIICNIYFYSDLCSRYT